MGENLLNSKISNANKNWKKSGKKKKPMTGWSWLRRVHFKCETVSTEAGAKNKYFRLYRTDIIS